MSKWSDAACDRLLRDVLDPNALDDAHDMAVLIAGVELGDEVTIDGRGRFTVVGYEAGGDAVKLDDGKERFTVYSHRVKRRATKGDGA